MQVGLGPLAEVAATIADEIEQQTHIYSFYETRELLTWNGKVYAPFGEERVEAAIESAYPGQTTNHLIGEILGILRRRNYRSKAEFLHADPLKVAFANGVYDLATGAFSPHSPDNPLLSTLAANYDSKARCLQTLKFLNDVLPDPDARRRLLDAFARTLDRRPRKRKATLLVGERDAGKSTTLRLLVAFLGQQNVSGLTLQEICFSPWAGAQLYGKAANIAADLPSIEIKDLGRFKAITGGDLISAQFKHKNLFEYIPSVSLLFSANVAPKLRETTDLAFFSRWDILRFPAYFDSQRRDQDLVDKLAAPEELSGLANILLGLARRQFLEPRKWNYDRSPEEVQNLWLEDAEPARAFILAETVPDPNAFTPRRRLFEAWEAYRVGHNFAQVSETRFNSLVRQSRNLGPPGRRNVDGRKAKAWIGLAMRGTGGNMTL